MHTFPQSITLKKGSHRLPSEGSCAMEVAILAAGYGWSEVRSQCDLPPCMSRAIGAYVIRLNDGMGDTERQQLLPFVTRMSGSASTPEVEYERARFLVMNAAKMAAVVVLRSAGLEEHANDVERAPGLATLRSSIWAVDAAALGKVTRSVCVVMNVASAAVDVLLRSRESIALACSWAAEAVDSASETSLFDWQPYLDALDGALKIGPQAGPIEIAQVEERTRVLVTA